VILIGKIALTRVYYRSPMDALEFLSTVQPNAFMRCLAIVVASLFTPVVEPISAAEVTYSFSGVMQGTSIFDEGTPFAGSFSYSYPQGIKTDGAYQLESYNLTILGQPRPISYVFPPDNPVTGTSWNGWPVNIGSSRISVSNGPVDSFDVYVEPTYLMILDPTLVRFWGPRFTFSDETGRVFQDTSLPDFSVVSGKFTSGSINISYSIDGGPSGTQAGIITSLVAAPWVTNRVVSLEVAPSVGGPWSKMSVGTNIVTSDGDLKLGALTNTQNFYRLKIRSVVE
jgi:hypothetical protein